MRASFFSLLLCSAVILTPVFAQSQPPDQLFVPILIKRARGGIAALLDVLSFCGTFRDYRIAGCERESRHLRQPRYGD